jgi:hypothetical protein
VWLTLALLAKPFCYKLNLAFAAYKMQASFFLLFRRGIPLAGIALSVAAAVLFPSYVGWALVAAMAILADLQSTFNTGGLYLAKRSSIVRWDGHWLQALRPFFRGLRLEDKWLLSFCAWNNQRVQKALLGKSSMNALLLLPHCIQFIKCSARIVEDLQSCTRCGACMVGRVADAAQNCRWDVRVAPRSRAAYLEARKARPDVVAAVACPDRLVKGLVKLPEIPSLALPLALPHGMCVDTALDFPDLSLAMSTFPKQAPEPNIQPLKRNLAGG